MHGVCVRCFVLLLFFEAHALALSRVPELGKYQPPLPLKQSFGDPKITSNQNHIRQTNKPMSSVSNLWIFSRTKVAAIIKYFIQRMLMGGPVTQVAIFVTVSIFIISCGAFLIWLACWNTTCTLDEAMIKSYVLLFRYFPLRTP